MVSVTCCAELLPVLTFPKLTLVADALSAAEGAVPVPLAVIASGEFVALLAIEIVAESAPALCGANATVSVALAPGAIVVPLPIPLAE